MALSHRIMGDPPPPLASSVSELPKFSSMSILFLGGRRERETIYNNEVYIIEKIFETPNRYSGVSPVLLYSKQWEPKKNQSLFSIKPSPDS